MAALATYEDQLAAASARRAESIQLARGAVRQQSDADRLMGLIGKKARETARWMAEHSMKAFDPGDGVDENERDLRTETVLKAHIADGFLTSSIERDVALLAELNSLRLSHNDFRQHVLDWVAGYGYIDLCRRIPDIEDLHINGSRQAFYKCGSKPGHQMLSPLSDPWLLEQFVRQVTRYCRPSMSELNALPPTWRIPGRHVRVKAFHPSVASGEYMFAIRFLRDHQFTIADLTERGLWTTAAAEFVRDVYLAGASVLVVGATGAGKSTLTYSLSEIVRDEYLVIIANPAEIRHTNPMHSVLEVREAVGEKGKEIGVTELVTGSLQATPDRLLLTEARGGELLPLLTGLSTGHGGSLTTIHADSLRDAVRVRMPSMIHQHDSGVGLTNSDIANKIASAFDLAIFIRKMATPGGGSVRQVMDISLVHPATEDQSHGMQVPLSQVFVRGEDGVLRFVGGTDYPTKLKMRALSSGKPLPEMSALAARHRDGSSAPQYDPAAKRALEAA